MSDKKKKKKKVTYYDDGRTIADMSGVYGKKADNNGQNANNRSKGSNNLFHFRPGHTPKDWLKTYWNTVKMTFLPMLATIGIVCAAFGILYLILVLAS